MPPIDLDLGDQLPTLSAGPVRLRWLTEADLPALFEIFGDPVVMRWFGLRTLADLDAARSLLDDIHEGFRSRRLFQWGVEAEGALVGTCTLAGLDPQNRRAELGFALGRAHWGQGHMSAALPAVLDFAFEGLGLHRVFADTDPRNVASMRHLERLGFVREGYMREHYLVEGEWQDAVMYGLLTEDWRRGGTPGVTAGSG